MKNKLFCYFVFLIGAAYNNCCDHNESIFTDDIAIVGIIQKSNNGIYIGYLNKKAEPVYNDSPYRPIKNAIVKITNDSQEVYFNYMDYNDETAYGNYIDVNNTLHFIPKGTYQLTVEINSKIFSSNTKIPEKPQIINLSENDTLIIPIVSRNIYDQRYGIVDKGQIKFKISSTTAGFEIKSFQCSSMTPYRKVEYHTFKDSAIIDFFFDSTIVVLPMAVSVSVYDSALSVNYYNNWTSDKRFIVFDSEVEQFYKQIKNKKLKECSNINTGLGFFGSFNSTNINYVARLIR